MATDNVARSMAGSALRVATATPAVTVSPVIAGTPLSGQTLTVSNGTWSQPYNGVTYQWKLNGSNISGATSESYRVKATDAGGTIICEVSAVNVLGTSSAAASAGVVIQEWYNAAVAFWDFNEASAPFAPVIGDAALALTNGSGSSVATAAEGPFGNSIVLDGSTDYLTIPNADVGALDVASSNAVTVVAWVNRADLTSSSFIAGRWQEDENNPQRQYGLFVDLPAYGGDNQVCGHISFDGDVTPGYPYSRDYSSNGQELKVSTWYMVAFTYDGQEAVSYLNAATDLRPVYTDSLSNTYAKNPYLFTDGLNPASASDFTVGACKLTAGMGNFANGKIGGVAIFDRALTAADITNIRRETIGVGEAVYDFALYRTGSGTNKTSSIGWKSVFGASGLDDSETATDNFDTTVVGSNSFMFRSGTVNTANITNAGMGYIPTLDGLLISEISSITVETNHSLAADTWRLAIRVGAAWYVTDTAYNVTGDGRTGSSWATSETVTVSSLLAAGKWKTLTFVDGASLALGATVSGAIDDGYLTGIGFYSPGTTGVLRFRNLKVFD